MNWLRSLAFALGFASSLAAAPAPATLPAPEIRRIVVEHIGPPAASDDLIRANIRLKEGDFWTEPASNEDLRALRATGYFRDVQVFTETEGAGVKLIYRVEGRPVVTSIRFEGNQKFSERKLRKKVTSKIGEPLDSYKLWASAQEMQKLYQKSGYQNAKVEVRDADINRELGRASVTFVIDEGAKVRVVDVQFLGAQAFSQRKLRHTIKTRRFWMFSWLTGSGKLKAEQFDEDRQKLIEFYQDEGYIDFEIREVKMNYVTPSRLILEFHVFEGRQYKVGKVEFRGNQIFSADAIRAGVVVMGRWIRPQMLEGEIFTPKGLEEDREAIEKFYGRYGYIGRGDAARIRVIAIKNPNVETGTMDLVYDLEEGQPSYIEKIEIRGNIKTRDRVIRRELAVSPGEVFNMVRVEISRERIRGLTFFDRVETNVDPTEGEVENRKNLVLAVEEGQSGNLYMGAGLSSVESIFGFVGLTQSNFDLFNPPYFTGGGQKLRLQLTIGTEQQLAEMRFVEPWFLGRRLEFNFDLYHRNIEYNSTVYSQRETGGRIGFYKQLISSLRGGISYTLEDIGIDFGSQRLQTNLLVRPLGGGAREIVVVPPSVSPELAREQGSWLISKIGLRLDFDRRGPGLLPDRGFRTQITSEVGGGVFGGESDFYKLDFEGSYYLRGFARGHVLELVGKIGVIEPYGDSAYTHIWDRFYLGGAYSLRGYKYRDISPEDTFGQPIGGDTYWMASAEYSIPIIERVRFAAFYDAGVVNAEAYDLDLAGFADDVGIGLRVQIPQLGPLPLRLDYAFPITHPENVSGKPRFQFSVGWNRSF